MLALSERSESKGRITGSWQRWPSVDRIGVVGRVKNGPPGYPMANYGLRMTGQGQWSLGRDVGRVMPGCGLQATGNRQRETGYGKRSTGNW